MSYLRVTMHNLEHISANFAAQLPFSTGRERPATFVAAGGEESAVPSRVATAFSELLADSDVRVNSAALAPSNMTLVMWTALFGAVNERIAAAVALLSYDAPARNHVAASDQLCAVMLECTDALEQLHAMFPECLPKLSPAQREVADTRAALEFAQTELRASQKRERIARDAALHDSLTGLPNRTSLMWQLNHACDNASADHRFIALLYFDLDALKCVNDEHGHDVGDALLCATATRLVATVPSGCVVSRFGGGEFICLLRDGRSRHALATLTESLINAISRDFLIGECRIVVRPSVGIAVREDRSVTPETLLKRADAAMYEAKRRQAGYLFADPAE